MTEITEKKYRIENIFSGKNHTEQNIFLGVLLLIPFFPQVPYIFLLFIMADVHKQVALKDVAYSTRGGDQGGKVLLATADATLADLMAHVGSDAIWLKSNPEELGDLVSENPATLIHSLDSSKILSIVVSCVRDERPGNPAKVKIQ